MIVRMCTYDAIIYIITAPTPSPPLSPQPDAPFFSHTLDFSKGQGFGYSDSQWILFDADNVAALTEAVQVFEVKMDASKRTQSAAIMLFLEMITIAFANLGGCGTNIMLFGYSLIGRIPPNVIVSVIIRLSIQRLRGPELAEFYDSDAAIWCECGRGR